MGKRFKVKQHLRKGRVVRQHSKVVRIAVVPRKRFQKIKMNQWINDAGIKDTTDKFGNIFTCTGGVVDFSPVAKY